MALVKTVKFNILTDPGDSRAKLDAIDAKAKEIGRLHPEFAVEVKTAAGMLKLKVLQQELKNTSAEAASAGSRFDGLGAKLKGLAGFAGKTGAAGGLMSLGSAAAAMSAPVAAAGLAVGAFGAVAIPVITKVHNAQVKLTAAQLQYQKAVSSPSHQIALQNAAAVVAKAQAAIDKATNATSRTAAMQQLASAQQHYNQVASNPAAKSALQAETAATAGLTSSQKQMMGTLGQLKGTFTKIENALSPLIEGVLKLTVGLTKDLLPSLPGLATAGAAVIKGFLEPFDRLVRSPVFNTFIGEIVVFSQQAGPLLGKFLVSLLKVFMQLFIQTMPAGLKLLQALLPLIVDLLSSLVPVIAVMAKLTAGFLTFLNQKHLLLPFLGVLAVAFLALSFLALSSSTGIGAVVIALTVLVAAAVWTVKHWHEVWAGIKQVTQDAVNWITNTAIGRALLPGLYLIIKTIQFLYRNWATIWDTIRRVTLDAAKFIVDVFLGMASAIINGAAKAFGWVPGIGPKLRAAAREFDAFHARVDQALTFRSRTVHVDVAWALGGGGGQRTAGRAKGWRVPGYGGGDRWPALLEGGEAVVPKHLVPALAPFLSANRVPGFAAGGVAGGFAVTPGFPAQGSIVRAIAEGFRTVMREIAAHVRALLGSLGGGGALGGDPAANRALARRMFPWPAYMWTDFDLLEMREAGFNRFARNPSSGAYGIAQALPPTKYPFAGQAAGGSHAGTQLGWMFGYIRGRYGDPLRAWGHEMNFGWYDQGGSIPPGLSLALNTTGRPERVGGGNTYHITVHVPPLGRPADVGREVVSAIRAFEKGSGAGWRK